MSDNWEFFPCAMGEDRAYIFIDLGIADSIDKAPTLNVRIVLTYKAPRPDGLPTNEEFNPVSAIEDHIKDFSDLAEDWYVGRVTVSGRRYFYVYTNRDQQSWQEFVATLSAETGYEIKTDFREDANHSAYFDDLYPTPDDWQVIKDQQVIEELNRHGDDGTAVRKVDHWIYFDDKEKLRNFLKWANSDRFTYEPENSHKTDDGRFCVRLFHEGTIRLADITSHTIALRRKAEELGGKYDGWETPVMTSDDS